jgi:creatinine amidohydrolase/Fe(II)-dependent formamide hydrolase-like protein
MKKAWIVVVSLALAVTFADAADAQRRGRGRRGNQTPEQQEARRAQQAAQQQRELDAAAAIEALDSVWIEELTWHEVRDALAAGKTTALIGTGGIEANGPYLATGKHNYVLQGALEGIARELGNALVAPIIKLVPEGSYDPPSGHMTSAGTISLRQETFEAVLFDVGMSLKAHGFTNIIYIGDSGGNQGGMRSTAAALNEVFGDASTAHFIPEFYEYGAVAAYMGEAMGIVQPSRDGFHDDFVITTIMMVTDPTSVRYEQRLAVHSAVINGLSIAPKEAAIETGEMLLQFRVNQTCAAINASIGGAARDR